MRTAGMVRTRKERRMVFYRLAKNFRGPILQHSLHQLGALSRAAQRLEVEER